MWENVYLNIKNAKASRVVVFGSQPQIAHFAHMTPLDYVGNLRPQKPL